MEIGYKLSSEEHPGSALVRHAQRAEACGFSFALISDHYHPWIDREGQSPFVWAVLGGVAAVTERLRVGTGVTAPIIRIHPAIVAQAAATAAEMMPGRFFLGVGTGENLNEHILGDRWPPVSARRAMLEEAVELIRALWEGDQTTFYGDHYVVENARIFTLPDEPPPIYVAAAGKKSATLAGKIGDGLISVAPKPETIEIFEDAGGRGKPKYAELQVCWDQDVEQAKKIAFELWPIVGMKGQLTQELALPSYFESVHKMMRPEDVTKFVACGPDPERHLEEIHKFAQAGFDHVAVHQVGPNQDGFFDFYEKNVLPKL